MSDAERLWESGWSGHDQVQLRRMAALSLIEKLEWLEEAQRVAQSLLGSRAVEGSRVRAACSRT